MVGAGRQDVARQQRVDRRHPLDAAGDLVRHVVGVELLHHSAVVGQHDRELMRGSLISSEVTMYGPIGAKVSRDFI